MNEFGFFFHLRSVKILYMANFFSQIDTDSTRSVIFVNQIIITNQFLLMWVSLYDFTNFLGPLINLQNSLNTGSFRTENLKSAAKTISIDTDVRGQLFAYSGRLKMMKKTVLYFSKSGSAGGLQFDFPAEVQVVSIEDAARETHTLAHNVVLLQPDRGHHNNQHHHHHHS